MAGKRRTQKKSPRGDAPMGGGGAAKTQAKAKKAAATAAPRETYVINPTTGNRVRVGGKTHAALLADPSTRALVEHAKTVPRVTQAHGCSNDRKWAKYAAEHNVPDSLFCGLDAGTGCAHAFPVFDTKHIAAAKRYQRFAPNRAGLLQCIARAEKKMA